MLSWMLLHPEKTWARYDCPCVFCRQGTFYLFNLADDAVNSATNWETKRHWLVLRKVFAYKLFL